MAISCNVYISEGRSAARLAALERAAGAAARAQRPAGACAHVYSFTDAPYHRSSFTFVGAPRAVARAARALAEAALGEGIGLDLREVRAARVARAPKGGERERESEREARGEREHAPRARAQRARSLLSGESAKRDMTNRTISESLP